MIAPEQKPADERVIYAPFKLRLRYEWRRMAWRTPTGEFPVYDPVAKEWAGLQDFWKITTAE